MNQRWPVSFVTSTMRMILFLQSCALLATFTAAAACVAAITVIDDRGTAVTLPAAATRIVTLAPSLTELVYAAGAGQRLVGVARYSDYPAAAKAISEIGDASQVDLERALNLRPDLIVAWKSGNHAADIQRLEQLGFTVFVAEPDRLASIPRVLRQLGTLAGTESIAQASAQQFESSIAALRSRYQTKAKLRVFYEIWHEPLMTVSAHHMITDVIELCGGVNVFAKAAGLTPLVSLESVMAAKPQVVLGGSSAITPAEFSGLWKANQSYAALRDVQAIYIDPDWIQRQTPRIALGARAICEQLGAIRSRSMN
jgi:iron complex transport system substrate-binding protein